MLEAGRPLGFRATRERGSWPVGPIAAVKVALRAKCGVYYGKL